MNKRTGMESFSSGPGLKSFVFPYAQETYMDISCERRKKERSERR